MYTVIRVTKILDVLMLVTHIKCLYTVNTYYFGCTLIVDSSFLKHFKAEHQLIDELYVISVKRAMSIGDPRLVAQETRNIFQLNSTLKLLPYAL